MAKFKVFYGSAIFLRKNSEPEEDGTHKYWATATPSPMFDTMGGLQNWFRDIRNSYSNIEDGEWKNFVSNIQDITLMTREEILDTDYMMEYKPSYEVVLDITITKRLEVTIDGDDYDLDDEDDAIEIATQKYEDGDYDNDIEYECEYERDMDIYSCSES